MNHIELFLKEYAHSEDGDNHDEAVRHLKAHSESGEVIHGDTGGSLSDLASHIHDKKTKHKTDKNFDPHQGEEKVSKANLHHTKSQKFQDTMKAHGWKHTYHKANDISHYDKGTTKVVHEHSDDYVSIHTHPTMSHKEHYWGPT